MSLLLFRKERVIAEKRNIHQKKKKRSKKKKKSEVHAKCHFSFRTTCNLEEKRGWRKNKIRSATLEKEKKLGDSSFVGLFCFFIESYRSFLTLYISFTYHHCVYFMIIACCSNSNSHALLFLSFVCFTMLVTTPLMTIRKAQQDRFLDKNPIKGLHGLVQLTATLRHRRLHYIRRNLQPT